MSRFLVIAMLVCLLKDGTPMTSAWDDKDFFSYCPPTRCSNHGPEIRYPFRLDSSNLSSLCGAPCMKLSCSGEDTILVHPALSAYKVIAIDYRHAILTMTPRVKSPCHLIHELISASRPRHLTQQQSSSPCVSFDLEYAAIVRCLRKFTPSNSAADYILGPISCLSNSTHFSYLVDGSAYMYILPLDCKVASDGMILIPNPETITFKEGAERILNFAETTVEWYGFPSGDCKRCELDGLSAHGGIKRSA